MKITFLFGAGAEGLGQIGMPFGNEFKKDIILADNVASFANAVNKSALLPISEIGEKYVVDPVRDLIPVCPNCHAAIHSKSGKKLAF